jgi:hypothetical protein
MLLHFANLKRFYHNNDNAQTDAGIRKYLIRAAVSRTRVQTHSEDGLAMAAT